MHTISVKFQPTMKVNIYNQCLNFKLMNRGCFSNGIVQGENLAPEVDTSSMMSVGFRPVPSVFKDVMTYELRRKCVKSSEELDLIHIRFFVVWKTGGHKKLRAYINSVEYEEKLYWNNTRLEEYYQRHASQLYTYTGPIKDTWLMHDGTVLMTELELDFTQRHDVLNITISEGIGDEYTRRPKLINPKM
jgi:hypothetical protein